MSLSVLPLSYCGNVHPTANVDELLQTLTTHTSRVQELTGERVAAGLWLADSVTKEFESQPQRLEELKSRLKDLGLICYTLNAFPFGNFHSERVKEQVYLPDWTSPERLAYTLRSAKILAELLTNGTEGSVSTVPLGFKSLCEEPDFQERCLDPLLDLAVELDRLHDDTGRVVRLAIEPEPLCVLETTAETLAFFEKLRRRAEQRGLEEVSQAHLGVCYDICHQSVEHEDVAASISALQAADIRINKVHITCAVELENPSENLAGRQFLAQFAEPRYLHQTFCRLNDQTVSQADLTAEFALNPPPEWLQADRWRIHFHVPVHAESLGPLSTTREDLIHGLTAVRDLEYAPHLEVETYTWNVLPGESQLDILQGMALELQSAGEVIDSLRAES